MDATTPHTVTADDGSFESGDVYLIEAPTRDTYSFTFDDVDAFPYHCEVHSGMTDTITVLAQYDPAPA